MRDKRQKDMRTKRVIALALAIALIISFPSCGLLPSLSAKKEAKKNFEYLRNKDIDKLVALFSDDIKDTHDLYKEWEEFFRSIDGNIVSYEKISTGGESERIDHGKISYYSVAIIFQNVETDTGKTYEQISYTQQREYKDHPENKGIHIFVVRIPDDSEKGFVEKTVGGFITYTD